MSFLSWLWRRSTNAPEKIEPKPDPRQDFSINDLEWRGRLKAIKNAERTPIEQAFVAANVTAIRDVVFGTNDPNNVDPLAASARMVVNISSAHIPEFCRLSKAGASNPYKNYYDLGKHQRIGDEPLRPRVAVDVALPVLNPKNIYFCAVELGGAGVRFYGDYCFVLKPRHEDAGTKILERNSYDLIREPIAQYIERTGEASTVNERRKSVAEAWSGSWRTDLPDMVALKVLSEAPLVPERLTQGRITSLVLDDERYIEVLREGSFGAEQLEEARTASSDTAIESHIVALSREGQSPRLDMLIWARRRSRARLELDAAGVQTRIVAQAGRVKS